MAGRKPDATDEQIIDVLRGAEDPVLSSKEVAKALPIKSNATQKRLIQLLEDGVVGKKVGQVWVWWLDDPV